MNSTSRFTKYPNISPSSLLPEQRRTNKIYESKPIIKPILLRRNQKQETLTPTLKQAPTSNLRNRAKSFALLRSSKDSSNELKNSLLGNGLSHHHRRDSLPSVRFAPGTNDANSNDFGTEKRLKRVALVKAKEGRWDESADLLVSVIKLQIDSVPHDHPDIANTKYHLANAYHRLGRSDQALRLLNEALDVMLLQKNNKYLLDLASMLYLIAIIEEFRGNRDGAIYYVMETQKIEVQALGYKSQKTIKKLAELQMTQVAQRPIRRYGGNRAA